MANPIILDPDDVHQLSDLQRLSRVRGEMPLDGGKDRLVDLSKRLVIALGGSAMLQVGTEKPSLKHLISKPTEGLLVAVENTLGLKTHYNDSTPMIDEARTEPPSRCSAKC